LSTYIFSESERDALPLFPTIVFYPQIIQKSQILFVFPGII